MIYDFLHKLTFLCNVRYWCKDSFEHEYSEFTETLDLIQRERKTDISCKYKYFKLHIIVQTCCTKVFLLIVLLAMPDMFVTIETYCFSYLYSFFTITFLLLLFFIGHFFCIHIII